MRALVTGGTGFIGGALADRLVSDGWEVRLLLRPESRDKLAGASACQLFEASLSDDSASLAPAVEGCDVIFHAAAIRNRWGTPPDAYWRTNVEGTRQLLFAALGNVPRFVYVSSVGVLGRPGVLGIDERFPPQPGKGRPGYHATKAAAEELVKAAQAEIDTVIVRPTITYGPRDADGMLTRMVAMLAGGRLPRIGDGNNHLHLTYISDLVSGLVLAGTHPAARNQTFILAGPTPITVRALIVAIGEALGLPHPNQLPLSIPLPIARAAAILFEAADRAVRVFNPQLASVPLVTRDQIDNLTANRGYSYAKAQHLLGYHPQTGYPEGIRHTVEWMAATGLLPEKSMQVGTTRKPAGKVLE